MAIKSSYNNTEFGVGDVIRVVQKITEGEKQRTQAFEGVLIGIKGRDKQSITVRRVGAQQVGIERIFPLSSPTLEKIEVVRAGGKGIRHAKLYYLRDKSRKETEKIYTRHTKKTSGKK
jgi:large subunit ribosomal protein L19